MKPNDVRDDAQLDQLLAEVRDIVRLTPIAVLDATQTVIERLDGSKPVQRLLGMYAAVGTAVVMAAIRNSEPHGA